MQVEVKVYNEILYVKIIGELDEHTASYLRTTLDTEFERLQFKEVIIDLSLLEFMDSTGIGVMIGRYKNLKKRKIPIFITNPSKQADKIFTMTALYDIMPKLEEGER